MPVPRFLAASSMVASMVSTYISCAASATTILMLSSCVITLVHVGRSAHNSVLPSCFLEYVALLEILSLFVGHVVGQLRHYAEYDAACILSHDILVQYHQHGVIARY